MAKSTIFFPTESYILGLGAETNEGTLLAFDEAINSNVRRSGFLIVKWNKDKDDTSSVYFVPTEPCDVQDNKGEINGMVVTFHKQSIVVNDDTDNSYMYKDLTVGQVDDTMYLYHKRGNEYDRLVELHSQLIDFFDMRKRSKTLRAGIIHNDIHISLLDVRNTIPMDGNLVWSHPISYHDDWSFTMPNADAQDADLMQTYVSNGTKNYLLSECILQQNDSMIDFIHQQSSTKIGYLDVNVISTPDATKNS